MFNFDFMIHLPFKFLRKELKIDYSYERAVTKNKRFRAQFAHFGFDYIFDLSLNFNIRGSYHSGIGFELTLFGFSTLIKLYDRRHWDYQYNEWCNCEVCEPKDCQK